MSHKTEHVANGSWRRHAGAIGGDVTPSQPLRVADLTIHYADGTPSHTTPVNGWRCDASGLTYWTVSPAGKRAEVWVPERRVRLVNAISDVSGNGL